MLKHLNLLLIVVLSATFTANSLAYDKIGKKSFANNRIDQIRRGDLEHRSKTLFFLDQAFAKHKVKYLDKISTSRFRRSRWYKKNLKKYVKRKRINWNHKSEIATQQFIINNDKHNILFVELEKKKDKKWYILDAYVKKNGRKQVFRKHGFTPGEINLNFWQLINILSNGTADQYYGLAPFGKLNKRLTSGLQLSPSFKKSLLMKNVIIHNGRHIKEMIFLTLKYYPVGHKEGSHFKSGWLIDDGGPMSTLYSPGKDLYIDYLLRRPVHSRTLNKPNKDTVYVNVPSAVGRKRR